MPDYNDTFPALAKEAKQAMKAGDLLQVLNIIKAQATQLKAGREADEIDSLLASYRMMMDYMAKGIDDPQRGKMYRNFLRRATEIETSLKRRHTLTHTTRHYTTVFLDFRGRVGREPQPLTDFFAQLHSERDIYEALWLSDMLTSAEETAVNDFITGAETSESHALLAVSGLTMGCLAFFDIAKYRILLDVCLSANDALRTRALAGLICIHLINHARVACYPEVVARLKMMADVKGFRGELEQIQMQLLISNETKRIEKDLREQIMPQIDKQIKELQKNNPEELENLKAKAIELDMNPEWLESKAFKNMSKYIRELTDLHELGADMYITTFSMLRGQLSFFNIAANWFRPFTKNSPEIPETLRENAMIDMLDKNFYFSDTDKYAYALMMTRFAHLMPNNMKADELKEMLEQGSETADGMEKKMLSAKNHLRFNVQTLYRFLNLFTYKNEYPNPFAEKKILLTDCPPFDEILSGTDFVARMADFAFSSQTYDFSLKLYERIPREELTAEQAQKLGYCLEKKKQLAEAVKAYALANALKPSSAWTLRHLANCELALEHYDEALKSYDELADILPDDFSISLRQAECYIQLKRHDEAFKFLFKAEYLSPDNETATRAIAWCSLLTKKYEQAERYYAKILAQTPTAADYLNAGHTAWLLGNVAKAVERYKHALPTEKPETFLDADWRMLLEAGISPEDLHVMTDIVLTANAE